MGRDETATRFRPAVVLLALHPLLHGTALLPLPGRETAMSDWLDDELAREDHRHGMAHGVDPDHCDACADTARRRMQAECEHDGDQADVTTLGDVNRQLLCQRCGAIREVPR